MKATMTISPERLKYYGYEFTTPNDVLWYIKAGLEYLRTHNKNYTDTQHFKIIEISDILNCIELREEM